MQVWTIRDGAINGQILDVVTSGDAHTQYSVIEFWRLTYLGRLYQNSFPKVVACVANHIE